MPRAFLADSGGCRGTARSAAGHGRGWRAAGGCGGGSNAKTGAVIEDDVDNVLPAYRICKARVGDLRTGGNGREELNEHVPRRGWAGLSTGVDFSHVDRVRIVNASFQGNSSGRGGNCRQPRRTVAVCVADCLHAGAVPSR